MLQRLPLSKYKLVVLGDAMVGKSSILKRFVLGTFAENGYQSTIAVDFLAKEVQFEDRRVRLQLWDTAGQERYMSLIPGYIRESSGALVVYDVAAKNSFLAVSRWVNKVREDCGPDIPMILVGNKTDLLYKRRRGQR